MIGRHRSIMAFTAQQILNHLIEESRKGKEYSAIVAEYIDKNKLIGSEAAAARTIFDLEKENYPNFHFVQSMLTYQYIKCADTGKYFLVDPNTKKVESIKEEAIQSAFTPATFTMLNSKRLYTARLGYNPNSTDFLYQEGLIKSVNLYRPADWQVPYFFEAKPVPDTKIPKVYHDYIMHLNNGIELSYTYTLNFLASAVQRNNRAYSYYTMLGAQGIGKGVLFDIVKVLVGPQNAVKIESSKLSESRFNDSRKHKKVIFFDELTVSNKVEEGIMKDYVNDEIGIESKGVDKKSYKNYANIMVASNALGNLKIEPGDRRYSFVDLTKVTLLKYLQKKHPETTLKDYIPKILQDPDNIRALGEFLLNFKINRDTIAEPIDSQASKHQKVNTLSDWEVSVFRELCPKNAGKEVGLHEVKEQLQDITRNSKVNPGREKWRSLSKFSPGYFTVKRKYLDNGEQVYALKFANKEDMPKYIATETED